MAERAALLVTIIVLVIIQLVPTIDAALNSTLVAVEKSVKVITVRKDGSGDFKTIREAVNTSDLLEVMLNSADKTNNGTTSSNSEASVSGPSVLVPFVKAIVPDIDMDKREMHITPPEGFT
ncbi:hypothetical protein Syun_026117 [Stephania yunnanensis]|uniref:Ribosome maturation factor RimM PRC barrel domain-containing protein n=1 Tax=Stephania yunnanensis TaxID=152371 RepID=A0AAP0HVF9_9MAGN